MIAMASALLFQALLFSTANASARFTPVDQFPSVLPNACGVRMCAEESKDVLAKYDKADAFQVPTQPAAFSGLCRMEGSKSLGRTFFMLLTIKDGRISPRTAGPAYDYDGSLNEPLWQGDSVEKMIAAADFSDPLWSIDQGKDFSFVDTRRDDNKSQHVQWLRQKDGRILTLGYMSFTAMFFCELEPVR